MPPPEELGLAEGPVHRRASAAPELVGHARALLAANRYLTLGTVCPDGTPWTSPVFYAAADERAFYWVSATGSLHSRNLAERSRVSIVVFDSTVAPFHGRALYAVGEAQELAGEELARGLAVYPGPSHRVAFSLAPEELAAPSADRLYRVAVSDAWVLCPREPRQPCRLHGRSEDHRTRVV